MNANQIIKLDGSVSKRLCSPLNIAGWKHSEETRRKMSISRKGRKFTPEHKAKIKQALSGLVREKRYSRVCEGCGVAFRSGAPNAKFHSVKCRRADKGHGLRHSRAFSKYPPVCAICGSTDQLVGDHDHASGAPRGILCRNCNLALGNMKDDPARLRAAADYLERTTALL